MPKAGFIVARVSFLVLTASMLGVAMLAVPAVAGRTSTCSSSDAASAGNLSDNPTGSCSLKFTAEPTDTAVGAAITSRLGSQGGPVKVEVVNGSGQLVTSSSAEVSVAIGPNSGPGTLSGTVMVRASGGTASFSDLNINQPGGYTLVATSPGITSATSTGFTIWNSLKTCPSSTCSGSESSATTSGAVTTSSAMAGDFIGIGIGGVSFSCGGTYKPVSDPFGFAVFSAAGVPQSTLQLTGMLRIDKSLVKSSGHPGASSWQICYASTTPFPGASGTVTIGGDTYHTGLLPDCTSTQGAPCVQKRNKNNAGDVIVTVLVLGDPYFRG